MDAIKKVALHLYALNKSDKTWLLDKLTAEERQNVGYFLKELESLGIPKDGGLVQQVINGKQLERINKEQPLYAKQVSRLNEFNSIQVYEALTEEPNIVIALIFAIYDWRWKERVMTLFTIERQNQLHSILSKKQADVKDHVKVAVLDGLIEEITVNSQGVQSHPLAETVRPMKKKTLGKKLKSLLRGERG